MNDQQPKSQLPDGLEGKVKNTVADESDQIAYLKGEIDSLNDALKESQGEFIEMKASRDLLKEEHKVLKENFPIKKSAVFFSKLLLIIVPIICLVLLLLSANGGLSITFGENLLVIEWSVVLNSYAQTALVIAPIAFITAILGFLLRGVFGQPNATDNRNSLTELIALINSNRN